MITISGLQNDHKAIMNEIEKRLGDYYDVKSTETMSVDEEQLLDPIAQVNMVTKDSPADIDVSIYLVRL